jgi:hypothetical protein
MFNEYFPPILNKTRATRFLGVSVPTFNRFEEDGIVRRIKDMGCYFDRRELERVVDINKRKKK